MVSWLLNTFEVNVKVQEARTGAIWFRPREIGILDTTAINAGKMPLKALPVSPKFALGESWPGGAVMRAPHEK